MKPGAWFFGEAGQSLLYQRVPGALQERRNSWTGVLFYDLDELPVGPGMYQGPPLTASIRSSMLTVQSRFADSIVT